MRYTVIATALYIVGSSAASSQEFSSVELPLMSDVFRKNEIRFKNEYIGKAFASTMSLRNVRESSIRSGTYHLEFSKPEGISPSVHCIISETNSLTEVAQWNKGDAISVSGVIDGYAPGMIFLKGCSIRKS